jgi:hypothetical protein
MTPHLELVMQTVSNHNSCTIPILSHATTMTLSRRLK